jgi:signal transduction histidine kinase
MSKGANVSDERIRTHAHDGQAAASARCLLVDDREDNLLSLEALLSGEPLEIHKARSGAEALELLLSHDFALALVDVHMPGMDGFELAEFMRGTERTRSIPIIFVTAGGADLNRLFKGYEAGAVDFLPKPLSPHVVKSKVRVFIELYRQRQRLHEQLAALQASQEETERALSVRNRFISIAGHELRTPLAVLRLQLQLGERRLPDAPTMPVEKVRHLLSQLDSQIDRLLPLVDEMLDASRIQSGKLRIQPEHCDLSEIVQDLVARFTPLLEEAGCTVKLECEPDLWGHWDRFRIEQVLANLLTNAGRYGAGAPVCVQAHARAEQVELVVADQGSGIPLEDHERIFQAFERAAGTEERLGLGLGLHIARNIVHMHGGEIRVESSPGAGARFCARLPLQGAEGVQ